MRNYLTLLLVLLSLKAMTQDAVSNSGNLQIHSSGSMAVFGSFTNTSTATLLNNGSLYIKNAFTNNQASMNAGSGTLVLNGGTAQTISGNEPLKTFHLSTNNSNGFTLNNNLHISGSHSFSAGIITTSVTPNYLVYESGSSYSGAGDAAHVNGWVKKIGTTGFVFPTGNGTYLREAEITNLASSSEFNARYNGTILSSARSVQLPLVIVNPNEYWAINQISGGTAQLILNWDESKVHFPNFVVADLRVGSYSGTDWINAGGTATGDATTTGSITSPALSTFGNFAIASTSWALPLKFLGIAAIRENSLVKINWKTANEIGVNYYEVQRSQDGSRFVTIGSSPAKNKDLQTYTYIDTDAPTSKIYYRIKSVDIDGSVAYSKIAIVAGTGEAGSITLLTNPVRSTIQLAAQNITSGEYLYQLINSAGQVCKQGSFKTSGTSVVSIPVSVIPGDYTLIINNSKQQQRFKVIVL